MVSDSRFAPKESPHLFVIFTKYNGYINNDSISFNILYIIVSVNYSIMTKHRKSCDMKKKINYWMDHVGAPFSL